MSFPTLRFPLVPDLYQVTMRHGARLIRREVEAVTAYAALLTVRAQLPAAQLVSIQLPGDW
jgi:hypothetical protein